ncbi:MAG: hypothetical protein U0360_08335 [Dehalococcoidia bacterium]
MAALDYLGVLISNAVWVDAGAILGTAVLTPEGTLKQHCPLGSGSSSARWRGSW